MTNVLFLVASVRQPGHQGNTEWLARQAAECLPAEATQTWLHLAALDLPAFVDQRHTVGTYPLPEGDLRTIFDATRACTDLVFVTPVYWYSFPDSLKRVLDHWSAWIRIPGVPFKEEMGRKRLWLVTTNGDRLKAQPMIDASRLCANFFSMAFGGVLWGKGGAPDVVKGDAGALEDARLFFR